ncbi:hypothetical protein CDEST_10989 [Colletotrichum destructivum]|uniref:Uncharacterized protein n=1 Tax=Colletotrichum destructivum TaxID=34406 RepID=A0AAX4IRT3_9PEZI|nr:hypothetical protein CDEST_10989 [Colletotrichum destructivum]
MTSSSLVRFSYIGKPTSPARNSYPGISLQKRLGKDQKENTARQLSIIRTDILPGDAISGSTVLESEA